MYARVLLVVFDSIRPGIAGFFPSKHLSVVTDYSFPVIIVKLHVSVIPNRIKIRLNSLEPGNLT